VVVCGGGLAGIAAACEASLLGADVTLVERRPFLGGKAYSFVDDDTGVEVDNGQHVFLGCCTAYIALLKLIGAYGDTTLQAALDAPVRDRNGRTGGLRASPLPAPLHLGPSFAAYPLLSAKEKAAGMRALLTLGTLRDSQRDTLDDVTFAEWLIAHGQSPGAIARFWDLIVLPTCNDRSERVSAALAAFVFQEGFFRTRRGSAIGWSRVGLTRLVDPPARRFLEGRGARIVTGRGVARAGTGQVELTDGEGMPADAVVLALPPDRARVVCPAAVPDDPGLGSSPIVNVHVWYDRPVMQGLFTAVVDSPAQWVFNRTAMANQATGGQHLAVSISGARREVVQPKDHLIESIVEELAHLFPAARAAHVQRAACIKEPDATFAAAPGQASRRPAPRTQVPGVVLAGAWTDTGWPATMEGAVRSGMLAARAAVAPSRGGEHPAASPLLGRPTLPEPPVHRDL
jgi:squalene-associated FAD-dependent desaturase